MQWQGGLARRDDLLRARISRYSEARPAIGQILAIVCGGDCAKHHFRRIGVRFASKLLTVSLFDVATVLDVEVAANAGLDDANVEPAELNVRTHSMLSIKIIPKENRQERDHEALSGQ